MKRVPSAISKSLESLQEQIGNVTLVVKNSNYYVYKTASYWDKKTKKVKSSSEYLGRITINGTFVQKSKTYPTALERAKKIIEGLGGQVVMPLTPSDERTEEAQYSVEEITDVDRAILTGLSMNGRARMGAIGKLANISAQKAQRRIKTLGNQLGINYTVEVDLDNLGYIGFVAFIKFLDQYPSIEEIKKAFENEPLVQFCAMLKGEYDVMLYILTENNMRTAMYDRIDKIRMKALTGYNARWFITPVFGVDDFIPIRESFFELLKTERVWERSKERLRPLEGQMLVREYSILKELTLDGSKEFKTIDMEYKLEPGSARYSYHKLREKGVIKRTTISMTKLPVKYTAMIMMERLKIDDAERTRNNLRRNLISYTNYPTNKYCLLLDIIEPDGVALFMPVFENNSLEDNLQELRHEVSGVNFKTLIITSIVLGSFCYRLFDNRYSLVHQELVKTGAIKAEKTVLYEA